MHGDGIGTLRARLGKRTNLGDASKACTILLYCGCKKAGTTSAVKPEFVALLYVHVRVLVQTMMVETMSDPVNVCDNVNSCKRPSEFTVVFHVIAVFLLC